MNTVFFGTSEFALPVLEKLAASDYRPMLVVTTPDAPAGRGREFRIPPVRVLTEKLGIPVIQPASLSPTPDLLFVSPFDLFVVAAYGKIMPGELLRIPKFGALNVHPSLLPRWRGASPIPHAILSRDAETGVTIIRMDEKIDHGPVLKFKNLNMESEKWTTPELTDALAKMGAELLLETISGWFAGKIVPVAQDDSQASYAKRLTREDGHIDWSKSSVEIEAMIRAFKPWPGAYALWNRDGNRLRLMMEEAEIEHRESRAVASPVGAVFEGEGRIAVKTGDGALAITHLKLEGGASMDAEAFLRGHRDLIGAELS